MTSDTIDESVDSNTKKDFDKPAKSVSDAADEVTETVEETVDNNT